MSRAEKMISLLNIKNRKEVMENLTETIQSYKDDNIKADKQLDYLFEQLKLDSLDEQAQNEIKNELLSAVKSDAGYILKSNYLWNTSNPLAPLKETVVSGDSIQGPDSNRISNINKRTQDADGMYRNRPKKKKQDAEETDIAVKLKLLKKLFMDRNQKEISIDDIRKILTTESEEQLFSAKQFLKEASEKSKTISKEYVLDYYFSESSPVTSTFSASSWAGFKYIRVNKTGLVIHSNSFLCEPGTILTDEKQEELEAMGVKIYFSESLNEEFYNQDNLMDEITYEEMLTTVEANIPTEEVQPKMVQREFDKLLAMKIKDAKFNMRKAAKQISIEVSWNNKRNR